MAVPALLPHQIPHYERISHVLDEGLTALDSSPVGSGKTYTTCRAAHVRGLSLLVVVPKSVKSKWRDVAGLYGVPVVGTSTYQGLRGTRRYQPNSPYLRREGDAFHPTAAFEALVEAGVLLVFDEFHNVKNPNTAQIESAAALVRYIAARPNTNSRVLLLSATPGDKKIHAFQFVRMLGISAQPILHWYNPRARILMPRGINDLLEWCAERDWEAAARVMDAHGEPQNATESREFAYQLFVRIVLPQLGSAMPEPELVGANGEPLLRDFKNGFYRLTPGNRVRLKAAIEQLAKAARPILEGRPVGGDAMGKITTALMNIEAAKRDLFVRLARETLAANPRGHVVILLNYIANVEYVVEALAEFAPIRYTGDMDEADRDAALAAFAEPNARRRLFIGTVAVANVGIDLDDKRGDLPRSMFISPDYRFIPLFQATGRIARSSTRSVPVARFVYGSGEGSTEFAIVDSLARKTEVAHSYVTGEQRPPFPGDLEAFHEIPVAARAG